MKRIFLVLAVAAVMAAILVVTVAPAFAAPKPRPVPPHQACVQQYLAANPGATQSDAAQACRPIKRA